MPLWMMINCFFFHEYWEERRFKAGPVRCVSLCAKGNENPKGYSGILTCVNSKDINPLLFPHFQTGKKLGGVGSSEENNCSSVCLEDNVLQMV